MIEWLVRGPATEIGVHVVVLVRRYSTMLVAGSSVAHVTVALFDVADGVVRARVHLDESRFS